MARGQDWRLQSPVREWGERQKVWDLVVLWRGRVGKRLAVGFSWGVGNGRVSIVVEDRSICHDLLRRRLIEMLERRETINCRLT